MTFPNISSFDIFDTLLLRPFRDPQELWRELERQEHAKGFAKARKKADAKTYRLSSQECRETSIEEAYAIMPKKFSGFMQKELDLERKVLCANPVMLKKWNEAGCEGKKRIICSDMYLSKEFLESVLRENGINGWDKFYLSRDYNARKTTGELYKVMLKDLGVKPEDVLHIGDNKHSDVEVPQSLGMSSLHYKKVYQQLHDVCPFIESINNHLAGTLAVGWNKFCYEHPGHNYWNRLGFMLGGILGYMYVKWIVETAQQLGKKRLLFIARDGYVLQKICNAIYPDIKTGYIYAPRMVSVAVNGVIGVDKNAMAQRQEILNAKLKDVDLSKIKDEYSRYVDSLHIDETCTLIDGCSSAFSAQRLVEECFGKDVFTFYLLAMSNKREIGALYQTNSNSIKNFHSLPFQMISEFLFCSPEYPIFDIRDCKPVYNEQASKLEIFKMNISDMITEGAVASAKVLNEEEINITNYEWMRYCDAFMSHLTNEDKKELEKAQNACDVEQKLFGKVTYIPRKDHYHTYIKSHGIPIGMFVSTYTKDYCFYVTRKGIHYETKDWGYKGKVITHAT